MTLDGQNFDRSRIRGTVRPAAFPADPRLAALLPRRRRRAGGRGRPARRGATGRGAGLVAVRTGGRAAT